MTTGRLIQPYSKVTWGGEDLSARGEGGDLAIVAQRVNVKFNNSQSPTCSFEFMPNPVGFDLFTRLKESAITETIEVELGYLNLRAFKQSFRYVGMNLTTGMSPAIRVETTGVLKGPFTDTRLSYTMEKKIPLKDLPDFLLGKLNPRPEIKFEFTKEALEVIADAEHQENQLQRSGYSILSSAIRPYGLRLDPGSSAFGNTVTISVAPDGNVDATRGGDQPVAGSRRFHIVGPGLANSVTRNQKFNIGQSNAKNGVSKNNNISREQDQQQAQEPQSGAQQPEVGEAKSQTAVIGPSNPQSSAESRSTGTTDEKAKKARVDETKLLTTDLTFSAPMLPGFMGLAPRDLILIPSIKGPADYIEDWEIDSVDYSQDMNGTIMVNVKANRPYIGDNSIASEGTLAQARGIVSSLRTPDDWARYYWGQ